MMHRISPSYGWEQKFHLPMAWWLQISVAPASGRRHLLRKDFGIEPVKLIPATPAPNQPAFSVRHKRGKGSLSSDAAAYWRENGSARRQLAVTPCTLADSAKVYGDINFDCQFTFVQVRSLIHRLCQHNGNGWGQSVV